MNTEPLANYIKANEALKAGDRTEAERRLAAAVGVTMCTPYMSQNLDKLVEEPNEVALTIILGEMKK